MFCNLMLGLYDENLSAYDKLIIKIKYIERLILCMKS